MTKQTKYCSGDMIPNGRSCGSNLATLVSIICPSGIYGSSDYEKREYGVYSGYVIIVYNCIEDLGNKSNFIAYLTVISCSNPIRSEIVSGCV